MPSIMFTGEEVTMPHCHGRLGPVGVDIYCKHYEADPRAKKVQPQEAMPNTVFIRVTCIDMKDGSMRHAPITVTGTRTNGERATVNLELDNNQCALIVGIRRDCPMIITLL